MSATCEQCGSPIPLEKVRKAGAKRRPRFCSRECHVASMKARNFYAELSRFGIAAQQQYKREHGVVPGYEQRKAALQKPDRTNKRKKRGSF